MREDFALAKTLSGRSQMDRVRAARAMLSTSQSNNEATSLVAFMSIFHPDFSEDRTRQMVSDVHERERNRLHNR